MKKKPLSAEGQLFQTLLLSEAKKSFGSTAKLNKDVVKLAFLNPNFLSDIEKIRAKFRIPKLDYDDRDNIFVSTGEKDGEVDVSKWVYGLTSAKRKRFYKQIEVLASDYDFPINFNDWLEAYVLYGKPEFVPKYPYEGLINALQYDLEKLHRVRLTTEEKKLLTEYFREKLGLKGKGRTSKKVVKIYKYFQEQLHSKDNTNKQRRLKNINIATEVSKRHGKTIQGTTEDGKHDIFYKNTYGALVPKIWKLNDNDDLEKMDEIDGKRKQNLRKINQRLKERINKIKK